MDLLEAFKREILKLYNKCLTCDREIDLKQIKTRKTRCKRCTRDYERCWFKTRAGFLKIFEGQM